MLLFLFFKKGPLCKVGIQNEIPSRSSNASNDYYAHCIKDKLVVGMSVRCRQSVQKLNISDTGIVTQIKLLNALHDYNVEVILDYLRNKTSQNLLFFTNFGITCILLKTGFMESQRHILDEIYRDRNSFCFNVRSTFSIC